jgi:hypothetical protein
VLSLLAGLRTRLNENNLATPLLAGLLELLSAKRDCSKFPHSEKTTKIMFHSVFNIHAWELSKMIAVNILISLFFNCVNLHMMYIL